MLQILLRREGYRVDLVDGVHAARDQLGVVEELRDRAEDLHEVRWLIELGLGLGFLPTVVAGSRPDRDALWPLLAPRLERNAIVLLKASRGMRLERLVPTLTSWATA